MIDGVLVKHVISSEEQECLMERVYTSYVETDAKYAIQILRNLRTFWSSEAQ